MLEPMPPGADGETLDWRRQIVSQMSDLSRAQQQTAIVLERLTNRLDVIDDWRKETRQEQRGAPDRQAVQSATLAQWVIAGIAVLALVISLAGPHIAFH